MAEFETPAAVAPVDDTPTTETPAPVSTVSTPGPDAPEAALEVPQAEAPILPVNPVRAAAGRLGAKRRQVLISLGKQYEQDHNLSPGRQRLKQLIQLGKRYEQEHGLKVAQPRRKRKGDAWVEFLTALARVIKPAYRPAVESLVAKLAEQGPELAPGKTAA